MRAHFPNFQTYIQRKAGNIFSPHGQGVSWSWRPNQLPHEFAIHFRCLHDLAAKKTRQKSTRALSSLNYHNFFDKSRSSVAKSTREIKLLILLYIVIKSCFKGVYTRVRVRGKHSYLYLWPLEAECSKPQKCA